jgi:hypothetical protein
VAVNTRLVGSPNNNGHKHQTNMQSSKSANVIHFGGKLGSQRETSVTKYLDSNSLRCGSNKRLSPFSRFLSLRLWGQQLAQAARYNFRHDEACLLHSQAASTVKTMSQIVKLTAVEEERQDKTILSLLHAVGRAMIFSLASAKSNHLYSAEPPHFFNAWTQTTCFVLGKHGRGSW